MSSTLPLLLAQATAGSPWESFLSILRGLWASDVVKALIVILIGYIVARMVERVVTFALGKTTLDNKLGEYLGAKGDVKAENIAGKILFWLVMVIAFVIALDLAGLSEQVTRPFSDMVTKVLEMIPNLIAAGILLIVTVVAAKFIRAILTKLLDKVQIDRKLGATDGQPVANALVTLAFWGVILMMLPAIFNALKLATVTEPLMSITTKITAYLPSLLAGAVVIGVGYLLGSIVQKIVYNVLNAAGFDRLPAKLGYEGEVSAEGRSPSSIVGYVAMACVIVLAVAQALQSMNLGSLSAMAIGFQNGFFDILGGVVILGLGIFVANWVAGLLDDKSATLAKVARVAIIVFAAAMGISQANIAPEISRTLFIAAIVAAAFAFGVGGAIAIGLGGREKAAKVIDKIGKS
ncbi:MAG: mechanosensitive ion channel [Verrucomicrobiae bacterium]|nr:mechanosensitive ion channel [Verrucomicrobiae bacterium]MCP5541344.1 mechanosensitive ion channel [Akkermansiaceae bacterium]